MNVDVVSLSGTCDQLCCRLKQFEHPAGGEGVWGAQQEVPSFLYGMPLEPGRVFLEETCLVTKPALPFAVLKRRLERRLKAMGIKVNPKRNSWNPSALVGDAATSCQQLPTYITAWQDLTLALHVGKLLSAFRKSHSGFRKTQLQ